ncbi:addiction module protein [Georgenia sp. TF02-10]|uniref:addiction module protein n=1 Tax=Georgenia sp. TF02-10 TaxID=2917725 RepID=UPI001FA816F1|nr:addiction module protein [Georgenia sp. TF02-10]UNX53994.1 addiction module protein [Georgenia sp. TF02-10]
MAPDVTEVERALLALAPEDRAAVIERGLRSLDDVDDADQGEVDAAWRAEIDRRVDEYVSSDTPSVDADEHVARLRAKLVARDK